MRDMIAEKPPSRRNVEAYFVANGAHDPTPLTIQGAPEEFLPHGLYAHGLSQSGGKLIAINHKSDKDAIEFFDLEGSSLVHTRSFSHKLLFNVNDCAATADFHVMYCTNWRSHKTGTFLDMAEVYLRLPWTNVVRCNLKSGECAEAARDLKMANGVQVSMNGKFLFVVESVRPAIAVFRILDDGTLQLSHKIPTRESCDNLSIDADGNLFSGCHPKAPPG